MSLSVAGTVSYAALQIVFGGEVNMGFGDLRNWGFRGCWVVIERAFRRGVWGRKVRFVGEGEKRG